MKISLIAALDENGGIGHHGRLPWRLSADLRRFKNLTMGHHLVMGRKTWESIGRPLPGRTLIVVTRKSGYLAEGCFVVNSFQSALEIALARGETELFVIGGGELYRLALPKAHRMYLTRVHAVVPADVFFPWFNPADWEIIQSQLADSGDQDEYPTTYLVLERRDLVNDLPG